ncbi:MAG: PLP-dependent aspartate aminotransferase family protein [Clostridia bacterium]|nr:PLP-dependent aspartate aminotransferase family protein [Clostridia bacterium]
MDIKSKVVHGSKGYDPATGSISFPIYQSATFRHPGLNQTTGYDYSRLQNPTREELENTLAALENGKAGFAFTSGMAAITSMMELFKSGDHFMVTDDLYGGTYRLFEELLVKRGMTFTYVDTRDFSQIEKALKDETRAIFIESPSNPMMKVADIKAIADLAKSRGMLLIVDNTFLTPLYQRPLELGADVVVHSGTKYLGGHNDTLAGFLVMNSPELIERMKLIQKTTGASLPPFDSWLILRGIKTLSVRMQRQSENALAIAHWLKKHPLVDKVYYVGLPEHEGHDVSIKQAAGFGAMISFTVIEERLVERILGKVKLIAFAESLGGVESLITYPVLQTHAAIPKEIRDRIGVNERLLRLSVGIEDVQDLIGDLEQALRD